MGWNRWIGGMALAWLAVAPWRAWAWDGDDARFRQQRGTQASLVWVERRGATLYQLALTRDLYEAAWLRRPALAPPLDGDGVTRLVRAVERRREAGAREIAAVMPVQVFGQPAHLVLFFGAPAPDGGPEVAPEAEVVLANGEIAVPVAYARSAL